ncbi:MAG: PQQ-binding-like beta-propeller repeat protein [Anaerolineae bacterium]|nr:PQQ-binding-like beta-propeller repeat protein [Anaerolineae bacterium]
MKHRRNFARRLSVVAVLGILVLALSGCGAKALNHESWPGMTVVGDTIYAANLEHIQALDAETGKLYWSFPDENDTNLRPFYSTPVLAPDHGEHGLLLVAGFKDKTVYALPLGESVAERPGTPLWTFAEAGGQYVGSGVVAGELFLIGNGDGKVYALKLADGQMAWSFATRGRVWATPVIIDGVVYIASLDHFLYAVDLTSGQELWHLEMQGSIAATPVLAGGCLWVADFARTLYQVDLPTHAVTWSTEASDWIWATPVVDDDILYFVDVDGYVYALDAVTRTMLWNQPAYVADTVHGRPVLDSERHRLFVAGYERGGIHVIDTETGSILNWGTVMQKPGRLPGDLTTDGVRLYTMPILVKERIQAFDLESGVLNWSYPVVETK